MLQGYSATALEPGEASKSFVVFEYTVQDILISIGHSGVGSHDTNLTGECGQITGKS